MVENLFEELLHLYPHVGLRRDLVSLSLISALMYINISMATHSTSQNKYISVCKVMKHHNKQQR